MAACTRQASEAASSSDAVSGSRGWGREEPATTVGKALASCALVVANMAELAQLDGEIGATGLA